MGATGSSTNANCACGTNDLKIGNVLGEGSFGIVRQITCTKCGQSYALKQILKSRLVTSQKDHSALAWNERNAMIVLKSPFTTELLGSFQTKKTINMVLPYYPFALTRVQTLVDAQVWLMEMIVALDHMREKQIVHRDLKLDNWMISEMGHMVLIDFGLATQMTKPEEDWGGCGSQGYQAPETFLGHLSSFQAEVFSLGVCVYKMCYGVLPWKSTLEASQRKFFPLRFPSPHQFNTMVLKQKSSNFGCMSSGNDCLVENFHEARIKNGYYDSDDEELHGFSAKEENSAQGAALKELIIAMLEVKPEDRITLDEIKHHKFFKGTSFEKVIRSATLRKHSKSVTLQVLQNARRTPRRDIFVRPSPSMPEQDHKSKKEQSKPPQNQASSDATCMSWSTEGLVYGGSKQPGSFAGSKPPRLVPVVPLDPNADAESLQSQEQSFLPNSLNHTVTPSKAGNSLSLSSEGTTTTVYDGFEWANPECLALIDHVSEVISQCKDPLPGHQKQSR